MRRTSNRVDERLTLTSGFTLVELVVVITIISILAAAVTLFFRNPIQSFIDSENRSNLTDRADSALRRMSRDIANALPNSVRVATNGNDQFIEFVPISSAGRYRASVGTSATDDPLDFNASPIDHSFDVLGPSISVAAGDMLVIYNLGLSGATVYDGSNIRPLSVTGSLNNLTFTGNNFPFSSPSNRFQTVSTAETFACDMTNKLLLRYSGYAIPTSGQPSSIATLNGLATARQLASNLSGCKILYIPGALQRNGLLTVYLTLTQNGETVTLMHQMNVANSP